VESEFSGEVLRAVERLATEVEELGRRQKAFEGLAERILAEQAELRQEQEELRQRQEAQSQEWQDFGTRLNVYSAAWETRLQSQMRELEGFARQLGNFTRRLAALLPPEMPPEE
jgi:predicted  nucleic acid-binding Zn-ribbon protein